MKRPATLPLVLALCLASPVTAKTAGTLRQCLNANGDGVLTLQEYTTPAIPAFDRADPLP